MVNSYLKINEFAFTKMRLTRLKSVRKRSKIIVLVSIICSLIVCSNVFGIYVHVFEIDLNTNFSYPLYVHNLRDVVEALKSGQPLDNALPKRINEYNYRYITRNENKCDKKDMTLLIVVKSALQHTLRRNAIRNSWGFETRFSDVIIKRVFILGTCIDRSDIIQCQDSIDDESNKHEDIVQIDFSDNYYNNTVKTMTAFKWIAEHCSHSQFILFADDDYYISVKNLLKYIRNPMNALPIKLNDRNQYNIEPQFDGSFYSGYVFSNSPPMRHKISKWYVSLSEYPYSKYPPYVTAGAFLLSNETLIDMYYASYYTKHFRFDDIYVAILAKKLSITPIHNKNFYFWNLEYSPEVYKNVIASHGFSDTKLLLQVWNQQKTLGNA